MLRKDDLRISTKNRTLMPVIYGFLERITYYNEENDFVAAKLQKKGKKELNAIVGNLSGINSSKMMRKYLNLIFKP